ncbi:hypothetical protein HU200_034466 [Digitaria exilis]|uniref:Uncharacterized protein n=1 Tax=Digitaria exilis TaxID=1010633 RepID=A0A835BV78_9POAL|nr:hypothetical protein HU200_034466 [Digitaria exilis]
MGPTAMADIGEDCGKECVAGCQLIAPAGCSWSVDQTVPSLDTTCVERFRGLCVQLCATFCDANTLPPVGDPICLKG